MNGCRTGRRETAGASRLEGAANAWHFLVRQPEQRLVEASSAISSSVGDGWYRPEVAEKSACFSEPRPEPRSGEQQAQRQTSRSAAGDGARRRNGFVTMACRRGALAGQRVFSGYSTGVSRPQPLISPRRALRSSLRTLDAWLGRVRIRRFGSTEARRTSSASRSRTSARLLLSAVALGVGRGRPCHASAGEALRRTRTAGGKLSLDATSKRSSTAVETLLTFCRSRGANEAPSISISGMLIVSETRITGGPSRMDLIGR